MPVWANALLAVALVSAIPLFVTFLLARNAVVVHRYLPLLVAFGTGALLGAAFLHLIPTALDQMSAGRVALLTGVGFAVFAGIERMLGGHDHAHAHGIPMGGPASMPESPAAIDSAPVGAPRQSVPLEAHDSDGPWKLVPLAFVGDALHNIMDAVLITAAFLVQPGLGLSTMVAIGLHELPREIGTFGLFVHGGVRPMRAVMFNLLTGLLALAAAGLTLWLGPVLGVGARLLVPIAAGTYIYIAVAVGRHALQRAGPLSWPSRGIAFAGGLAIMAFGAHA